MPFRPKLGVVKKNAPSVSDPAMKRVVDTIYKDINSLSDSLHLPSGTHTFLPREGKPGDIRLYEGTGNDGTSGYFLQGRVKDGWASVKLTLETRNPENTDTSAVAGDMNPAHITRYDVTRHNIDFNGDMGTGVGQVARGDHTHTHWTNSNIVGLSFNEGSYAFGGDLEHLGTIHFPLADTTDTTNVTQVDLDNSSAGTLAFAARVDHKHKLDEDIEPIWTGGEGQIHTFGESVGAGTGMTIKVFGKGQGLDSDPAIDVSGNVLIDGALTVAFAESNTGQTVMSGDVFMNTADSTTYTTTVYGETLVEAPVKIYPWKGTSPYNKTALEIRGPADTGYGQLRITDYSDANMYFDLKVDTSGNLLVDTIGNIQLLPEAGTDTPGQVLPKQTLLTDLGDFNRMFRSLFVGEIYAETLVAQDVLATIGGRISVAPTTMLEAPIDMEATSIRVRHNIFDTGDFAIMKSAPMGLPQTEIFEITNDGAWANADISTEDNLLNLEYGTEYDAYQDRVEADWGIRPNARITVDTGDPDISGILEDGQWILVSGTGGHAYDDPPGINGAYKALIKTANPEGIDTDYDKAPDLELGQIDLRVPTDVFETLENKAFADMVVNIGPYTYNVNRSVANIGLANRWQSGDAIMNLGHEEGDGFIELTSTETAYQDLGPAITLYSRDDTEDQEWNDAIPVVSFGQLRSFVDYNEGDLCGMAIGKNLYTSPADGFQGITADPVKGVRLFNTELKMYTGTDLMVHLETDGNFRIGTGLSVNDPIVYDASGTKFSWDGATIRVKGNMEFTEGDQYEQLFGEDTLFDSLSVTLTGAYQSADAAVQADADAAQEDADAAQNAADAAAAAALAAQEDVDDIGNDDKVTPSEKEIAYTLYTAITNEYAGYTAQGTDLSVSTTAYDTAYNALVVYIGTTLDLFDDMAATTTIVRATWNTTWNDYYNERSTLLTAIADAIQANVDSVQDNVDSVESNLVDAENWIGNSLTSQIPPGIGWGGTLKIEPLSSAEDDEFVSRGHVKAVKNSFATGFVSLQTMTLDSDEDPPEFTDVDINANNTPSDQQTFTILRPDVVLPLSSFTIQTPFQAPDSEGTDFSDFGVIGTDNTNLTMYLMWSVDTRDSRFTGDDSLGTYVVQGTDTIRDHIVMVFHNSVTGIWYAVGGGFGIEGDDDNLYTAFTPLSSDVLLCAFNQASDDGGIEWAEFLYQAESPQSSDLQYAQAIIQTTLGTVGAVPAGSLTGIEGGGVVLDGGMEVTAQVTAAGDDIEGSETWFWNHSTGGVDPVKTDAQKYNGDYSLQLDGAILPYEVKNTREQGTEFNYIPCVTGMKVNLSARVYPGAAGGASIGLTFYSANKTVLEVVSDAVGDVPSWGTPGEAGDWRYRTGAHTIRSAYDGTEPAYFVVTLISKVGTNGVSHYFDDVRCTMEVGLAFPVIPDQTRSGLYTGSDFLGFWNKESTIGGGDGAWKVYMDDTGVFQCGTTTAQGDNFLQWTGSALNIGGVVNVLGGGVTDGNDGFTSFDDIQSASVNFNSGNDMNGDVLGAPGINNDGTAIDHTTNTDSSCDISFEWTWNFNEDILDGFIIWVYRSTSSNDGYTIGDSPGYETAYFVPYDRRSIILQGLPQDLYYTFGVRAYRSVNTNISSTGFIYSNMVQPVATDENPYYPVGDGVVEFDGDITGTIDGTGATAVVTGAALGDSSNQDSTATILSGNHTGTVGNETTANLITGMNNANTAHGWGNHASAGYGTGTVSTWGDLGDLTASNNVSIDGGSVILGNTNGSAIYSSGHNTFNSGTAGFWMGRTGGTFKFDIGSAGVGMQWTGSKLKVQGVLDASYWEAPSLTAGGTGNRIRSHGAASDSTSNYIFVPTHHSKSAYWHDQQCFDMVEETPAATYAQGMFMKIEDVAYGAQIYVRMIPKLQTNLYGAYSLFKPQLWSRYVNGSGSVTDWYMIGETIPGNGNNYGIHEFLMTLISGDITVLPDNLNGSDGCYVEITVTDAYRNHADYYWADPDNGSDVHFWVACYLSAQINNTYGATTASS